MRAVSDRAPHLHKREHNLAKDALYADGQGCCTRLRKPNASTDKTAAVWGPVLNTSQTACMRNTCMTWLHILSTFEHTQQHPGMSNLTAGYTQTLVTVTP